MSLSAIWRQVKKAPPPTEAARISRFLALTATNTLANANVSVDLVVPDNEVWVLKNLTSEAIPGAAMQVAEHEHIIVVPGGAPNIRLKHAVDATTGMTINPPVNESSGLDWEGELIIPPRYTIRAFAVFTGAVPNTMLIYALGHILTPEYWPIYASI